MLIWQDQRNVSTFLGPVPALLAADAAGNVIGATTTGDVVIAPGSMAATIQPHVVSYAKMQQASAHVLLGNPTAGTADLQEITLGTNLSFTGSVLNATGGSAFYQTVYDPSAPGGVQPQRSGLAFGESASTLVTNDDAGNDWTNVELAIVSGNPFDTGASSLPGRIITNLYGQIILANSIAVGSGLTLSGGTLSATGGGSGTVMTVSGTAPIFITSTPTTTPNVVIHGAITTGGTATSATSLGALASGVLQQSVSAGVSTPSVFAAGATRVPFGSGTAGGLADSANLTFASNVLSVNGGLSFGTHITGVQASLTTVDNLANFTQMLAYQASGTNVGMNVDISPRGTGFSSTNKASIQVFNTDYFADPLNFEVMIVRSTGTAGFVINSSTGGTGTTRPIVLSTGANTTQLTLNTDGTNSMGSLAAGGIAKAAVTTGQLGIASAADVAAAISWPASPRVLISGGTSAAPVSDSTFTFDTTNHGLAAGNFVGINAAVVPSNASLVTGLGGNADRDRVVFFLGGGALGSTGTGDNTLFDLNPAFGVAIRAGVTGGIYATQRIRAVSYSGSSVSVSQMATLYIDGAPSIGGGISSPSPVALFVAAGQTKLGGNLTATLLTAGGVTAVDATGTFGIAGVGGMSPAICGEQHYYINATGASLATGANNWLVTSQVTGVGNVQTDNAHSFAAVKASLSIRLLNNPMATGSIAVQIMRNGGTFASINILPSSLAPGTIAIVPTTVGSPAAGDTWGVLVNGTATFGAGNMIFTVSLMLAPNVF
jgi:hypothetical protein